MIKRKCQTKHHLSNDLKVWWAYQISRNRNQVSLSRNTNLLSIIEIINEKWNIFAPLSGYRFLESDPLLECCKRNGVRDSCLRTCREPDERDLENGEWERLGLLYCGVKMFDRMIDCLNGNYIAIDCIYVFIKRTPLHG